MDFAPPAEVGPSYRRVGGALAVGRSLFNLVFEGGALCGMLSVATGALVLTYGFLLRQRIVFALGGVALLGGVVTQVRVALELYSLPYALSLGISGVAIILAASLLERHHHRLLACVGRMRDEVKTWET